MFKYFDASFFGGTVLTLAALALAYLALTNSALPVVGGARGALIAVTVIGFVACPVGGISQASTVGWTNPVIVAGSVVGVAMLLVVAAGLFGWDAQLRPVAQFVPGALAVDLSTERLAIFALAALMLVKWVLDIALTAWRGLASA